MAKKGQQLKTFFLQPAILGEIPLAIASLWWKDLKQLLNLYNMKKRCDIVRFSGANKPFEAYFVEFW